MPKLSPYQRYLIEEFADEYRERHISRRDLLRRALLITGSIPAAAAALAALGCGRDDDDETGAPTGAATTTTATTAAANTSPTAAATATAPAAGVMTGEIRFPGPASELHGFLARPGDDAIHAGIIVIHENRGLNDHIRDVATRFAGEGFAALAVDLVSRNGGSTADSAANMGFLSQLTPEEVRADLQAHVDYLLELDGVKPGGVGVIGFCLGGGYTWEAAVGVEHVLAAVPFYGPCAVIDELGESRAAILAIYGGNDTRVTSQAEDVRAALEARDAPFELHIYPGANHAFFNDTGQNYNADAAADAFEKTVAWFRRYV